MSVVHIFPVVLALISACFFILVLRPLASGIGLVDSPEHRRLHDHDAPLVGGVAMYAAFIFSILFIDSSLAPYRAFIAATFLLIVVGLLDDLHELSSPARFVVQVVAIIMMIYWGGVSVQNLGAIVGQGDAMLGSWHVVFTIVAAIGVINAINMSDGLDGLAGGLVLVALSGMLFMVSRAGMTSEIMVLLILMTTVLVFLNFNVSWPWRKGPVVFMGDAGSMFLGFCMAWFTISLSQGESRAMAPVTALWFLAVPLFDAVAVSIYRLATRRSPFQASLDHMHHILLNRFGNRSKVVAIQVGIALMLALFGVVADYLRISEQFQFKLFLFLFAVYFVMAVRTQTVQNQAARTARTKKRHA